MYQIYENNVEIIFWCLIFTGVFAATICFLVCYSI